MKVVFNNDFGGFELSYEAIRRYLTLKGKECFFYIQTKTSYDDGHNEYKLIISNDALEKAYDSYDVSTSFLGEEISEIPDEYYFDSYAIERTDSDLIKVIEELGEDANTSSSKLEIIDLPDGQEWKIEEYDGLEKIKLL